MAKEKEIKHERHVLIVDDQPDYLGAVGDAFRALSEDRWQVHTAASEGEALEMLKVKQMELVVLDVNAPVADGARFLAGLQRDHPKMKKAVMVSVAMDEKRAASLASGADLFLEKPVSPEGMKSVFARLCRLLDWTAPRGFQGVLRSVGLMDLVQMECLARNSSILELYREQSLGRIYIEDGQIIHAVCGEISGEGAFHKLLSLNGGTFELHEFELPPERTVNRTWEFLLAEAKRHRELLDFRARTGEASADGAEDFSSEPAGQASEMLVCSGDGEALYNWKCPDPAARVALMQNIARRADQLIPQLQLGKLDRLEIQLAGDRAILQPRADRMIFVRVAANPAKHEG
jgi:CheY-like chemotaxis protein